MRRLLVLACLGSAAASDETEPFAAVAVASGDEYPAARDALLAREDAAAILHAAKDGAESELDRWLAEVLLVRLEQAAAFRDAQRDYREKLDKLYHGVGMLTIKCVWVTWVGRGVTVLVPGEELPKEWRGRGERWAQAFDETRLEASPVRTLALAEIALKGVGKLPADPSHQDPSEDDLRFGALHRLLRDGEGRVLPAMLQFLKDPASSVQHRALAARMLGCEGYKEALPEFLRLAEDEGAATNLRDEAIHGIGSLGDPAAIPTLERIVARGKDAPREPGNLGPRRFARLANVALQAIRGER